MTIRRTSLVSLIAAGLLGATTALMPASGMAGGVPITDPAQPSLGPYSHAVRAGDMLFLSGVIGFDGEKMAIKEGGFEAQFHQAMANVKSVLAAAGSSLDEVVKVTVFLQNPSDFARMNELYPAYFPGPKPARSTVPGVEWGKGVLVEVEVTAWSPQEK